MLFFRHSGGFPRQSCDVIFRLVREDGAFKRFTGSTMRFFVRFPLVASWIYLFGGCSLQNSLAINSFRTNKVYRADIASITAVIRSRPSDPEGYNVRGAIYGESGDFEKALQDFQTALDLNPQYYKAHANRALVYRKMRDIPMAIASYGMALKINPNYDVAYIGRGNLYRENGGADLQKAFADFDKAIRLGTFDGRAWHGRALIYQTLGKQIEAIEDFSRAISLGIFSPEPYNGRGLSYMMLKDYENALEDFRTAIDLDPKRAESFFNQGLAYEAEGNNLNSLDSYHRALFIDSGYHKAKIGMNRVRNLLSPS